MVTGRFEGHDFRLQLGVGRPETIRHMMGHALKLNLVFDSKGT